MQDTKDASCSHRFNIRTGRTKLFSVWQCEYVSCKYRILSPGNVAPFPASRMEDSTLQSTIRNGAKRSQASESGTLFSLNVGRASLLRVHYHLKWVGHHFYCQIMWAQILLDCGSWRLSLRAATPSGQSYSRQCDDYWG